MQRLQLLMVIQVLFIHTKVVVVAYLPEQFVQ